MVLHTDAKQRYIRTSLQELATFDSCGFFQAEANWVHEKRSVDSFLLLLVLEHHLYIEVAGKRYRLNTGDLYLIPPGVEHQGYEASPEGTVYFWLHFQLKDKTLSFEEDDGNQAFDLNNLDAYDVILPLYLTNVDLGKAVIYCHQICDTNESKAYVSAATDVLVTALLMEISSQYISKHDEQYYGNIQKILEWIRIHYTSPISVRDVAEHFEYSINYMSHYFSKHVGISMQKYITMKRIRKACELLLETRDTAIQIAAKVGFKDSKYFLRVFKQYMKQTPTAYRNAFNQTHYNKE